MADFEAPSFSLGLDFEVPSFSLGLDFDLDDEPPPSPPAAEEPTTTIDLISSQSIEDQDPPQTLISDPQLHHSSSPPTTTTTLKRLKRGPPTTQSPRRRINKQHIVAKTVDDEIEDVSSPEDNSRDDQSAQQNRSTYSSLKFSSHGYIPLSTQLASKLKSMGSTQASNASTLTSVKMGSNKTVFPNLMISPLRRFQLLDSDSDSDSDDLSSSEDILEDAKKFDVSARKKTHNADQSLIVNQQKRDKVTGNNLQTEDLWKDFSPQKSVNIPTPALDDFCEEYFRSLNDKNVDQTKDNDIYVISSKVCDQKNDISGNNEFSKNPHNSLPPSSKYFNHDDSRIQRLVHNRLPNFSPLGVNDIETPQSLDADIDYMCQFSQKESTYGAHGLRGSSRMGRKNTTKSSPNDLAEISGIWVNPRGCTSTSKNVGKLQGRAVGHSSCGPKNAGKRRVRAEGSSSGSWFTGEDGRKVYVTKDGQELMGQAAYRRYRKESGTGFKKSRKKGASKKRSKRS